MRALSFKRALPLTVVLLGGCLSVPAYAAADAAQWLNRLAQAEQQQSFQGTFIYERSGSFSTHDIWHRAVNGQVSERLLQLDGPAREAVRVNGATRCVSGAPASTSPPMAQAPRRRLDPLKLMSWYTLGVAGDSRVAGRDTVVVTMSPRDQQRYGYELHLDKQTGLLLKSLLISEKGQLLERFQFTRFAPVNPADGDLSASAGCVASTTAAGSGTAAAGWRSDWLPSGFELVGSSVHQDPQRKVAVSSLLYDDGLARFSVFIEPLNGSDPADTRLQLGPTSAVSRRLMTPSGEVLVTVVGEVPVGTAERVALSVRVASVRAADGQAVH